MLSGYFPVPELAVDATGPGEGMAPGVDEPDDEPLDVEAAPWDGSVRLCVPPVPDGRTQKLILPDSMALMST